MILVDDCHDHLRAIPAVPPRRYSGIFSAILLHFSKFHRFIHFIKYHYSLFTKPDGVRYSVFFGIIRAFFASVVCRQTEIFFSNDGLGTAGFQDDIFKNPAMGYEGLKWGDCPTLSNGCNQSMLLTSGGIAYIRKYGFYQGNVCYRIDPVKVLALITGLCPETIATYLEKKRALSSSPHEVN